MIVNRKIIKSIRLQKALKRKTLTKTRPHKKLITKIDRSHGRNQKGHKSVAGKLSGRKKLYRKITFKRETQLGNYVVKSIEYDPNRTTYIALVEQAETKTYAYILAPQDLKIGATVHSDPDMVEIKPGNATKLINLPVGTVIHNIDGKYVRSAGDEAVILGKQNDKVIIKMPSKKKLEFSAYVYATIGQLSNANHINTYSYKAGQNYHRGKGPKVRGVAMNPVDHPHGGGEGRTGTKRAPVNRTGRHIKGKKTSRSKRKVII